MILDNRLVIHMGSMQVISRSIVNVCLKMIGILDVFITEEVRDGPLGLSRQGHVH